MCDDDVSNFISAWYVGVRLFQKFFLLFSCFRRNPKGRGSSYGLLFSHVETILAMVSKESFNLGEAKLNFITTTIGMRNSGNTQYILLDHARPQKH